MTKNKLYILLIDGTEMYRGSKEDCYKEMNRLLDTWLDSLPDEATIEIRKVKE